MSTPRRRLPTDAGRDLLLCVIWMAAVVIGFALFASQIAGAAAP